ncbi:hypothetical protein Tco_0545481 [Tanacetum coccineum]
MFDEYFNPPPSAISPVQVATTPRAVDLADSLVSTSINQDTPSTSIPSTQEQEKSPIISQVKPKNYKEAMLEPSWIDAMQEEIHEFERLQVWELVPCPDLVIIEAIRIFIANAATKNMTIYQMDVKTAFLNNVDDGKMTFFLGLQISQSPKGIFINQFNYALEIIKKYGMLSSDPVDTPMVDKSKLDKDLQGKPVDPTHYRSMIGSLMYLTSSRPVLVFSVCMCTRYQAKPTEKHLHAVKRIFRYLKGTIDMGLWYSKDSCITLIAYADADLAECQDTRQSTSRSAQFFGDKLVSWSSKKQKSTAISST